MAAINTDSSSKTTQPSVVSPDADKLNLGCGDDIRDDWRNADISESVPADDHFDMSQTPWPYPDNSFDYVLAKHCLEHLEHDAISRVFREVARVLQPDGVFEVRVPFGADDRTDPTHKTTWDWLTPERFTHDSDYGWETGQLPFELEDKDANVWCQPPPRILAKLWYQGRLRYWLWRHGPDRWITSYPFVSGEILATYRRIQE